MTPVDDVQPNSNERLLQVMRENGFTPQHEHLLGGELAGPASADRPDTPIWDYLALSKTQSKMTLDQLLHLRFPVHFLEGGSTITSIAEEATLFGQTTASTGTNQAEPANVKAILDRYRYLHNEGAIAWDSKNRALLIVVSISRYREFLGGWSGHTASQN
jgi:hypothetical protein